MDLSRRHSPSRVLIVDDCPDTLESMGLLLRMWGFGVLAARDGEHALQLVGSYRPAVVLLDLILPGMDGFEVARRLRAEGGPTVVCLSGWGGEEVRRRCLEAGCHLHLTKPVDPQMLRRLLACLAGQQDGPWSAAFLPSPSLRSGT